ncbi:MAG: N-acetylneuraminate synthase family protein [Candidatus Hodarchaeales archaeon]|jgi:sialic acid synthase SpsE
MNKIIKISSDHSIGTSCPVFIIAEAGINHNGNVDIAKKLIVEAKQCGADAIKFQAFKIEKLLSGLEIKPEHLDSEEPLFKTLKSYEFSKEEFKELKAYAEDNNIIFFASAIDEINVDILDDIGVSILKIASCDITNLPLLQKIARKQKPMIMSTGMATIGEIEKAIEIIRNEGNNSISLLHCISLYPPQMEEVNLNSIPYLREVFKLPIGFSDHTLTLELSLAAVSLGATIIERHFTLDRDMPGPDQAASLEPDEFKLMVKQIRNIGRARGIWGKPISNREIEMRSSFRRSIVASRKIMKGETITRDMLDIKRPGTGISPIYFFLIIGRKAVETIKQDQLLTWDDI